MDMGDDIVRIPERHARTHREGEDATKRIIRRGEREGPLLPIERHMMEGRVVDTDPNFSPAQLKKNIIAGETEALDGEFDHEEVPGVRRMSLTPWKRDAQGGKRVLIALRDGEPQPCEFWLPLKLNSAD